MPKAMLEQRITERPFLARFRSCWLKPTPAPREKPVARRYEAATKHGGSMPTALGVENSTATRTEFPAKTCAERTKRHCVNTTRSSAFLYALPQTTWKGRVPNVAFYLTEHSPELFFS
jgi:hypothetical protein